MPELPFNKDLLAFPSPGEYKLREDPGKDKLKYSLRIRVKDYFKNENPSPDKYNPSHKYVFQDRYQNIGFGFGNRPDINPLKNILINNPGPGTYVMPSVFDKFKNRKRIVSRNEKRPQKEKL